MKDLLRLLIMVLMLLSLVKTVSVYADTIYIADPVVENNLQTAKTLISIFNPDGTEQKKVLVDGIMARVSPNGKNIVYIEQKTDGQWEVALANAEGEKIKNLPVTKKVPQGVAQPRPTNLIWSPDGEKIAIVRGIQQSVSVIVFNMKTDDLKVIYAGRSKSSSEKYFYAVKWFPDGKRLFVAGSDGTRIIDTETREETVVSATTIAYLSNNGKKIFYVPQLNEIVLDRRFAKPPIKLYEYDIGKKTSELFMTLNSLPLMAVLSSDDRYLAFQDLPIVKNSTNIFIVDLLKKELSKVDTNGLFLIPKRFSSFKNNLLICVGSQKKEDMMYGILNLSNGEFLKLKESLVKNLRDEFGVFWFAGFDWYDWR